MRERWYDPGTGNWLTSDPLSYRDSANLYAFAGGDPVNGRDPNGTKAIVTPQLNVVISRPGGKIEKFTFAEARRNPTALQAALDTDDETSSDEVEHIMGQLSLPVAYDAVCANKCISTRNFTYKTHLPHGGRGDFLVGALMPGDLRRQRRKWRPETRRRKPFKELRLC